jgi:hypothetical protein
MQPEIVSRSLRYVSIIVQMPKRHIARRAEQASENARYMIVISMKSLPPAPAFDWLRHLQADSAKTFLSVVGSVVLTSIDMLHYSVTLIVGVAKTLAPSHLAAIPYLTNPCWSLDAYLRQ